MTDSDNILRQVQLTQLEILTEVDKICRKHNIKYFLISGTLLGAVRHKGFIPWDDDVDIGMHRKDYDLFLEIAGRTLAKKYFCQSVYSEPDYYLPYAKVRKNGTKYVEASIKHLNINKGVYIDVFPIDNVPDNALLRFIHRMELQILFRMVLEKSGIIISEDQRLSRRVAYTMLRIFFKPFKKRNLLLYMDQRMKAYSGQKTTCLTNIGSSYGYTREQRQSYIFESLSETEFEGRLFYVPVQAHEYLTGLFGDYMTPPPVDQRENRHGIVEVQL